MPSRHGPLDAESDSSDERSGAYTPSCATSCFTQGTSRAEIKIEKSWEGKDCSDGVWEHATRGHGAADEGDEQDAGHVPANGHTGHFGVFAGNWGGKWNKPKEDDYMNDDIWNSVCQVILMQEVDPLFWIKMKKRQAACAASKGDGALADEKPLFVGVKGEEGRKDSLLIAGRPGIVLGIRLKVFHKTIDGPYKGKKKEQVAESRIMVAELKMKNFRIRGSGESDILPVASVHMHSRTAKKDTKDGVRVYKTVWDLLGTLLNMVCGLWPATSTCPFSASSLSCGPAVFRSI